VIEKIVRNKRFGEVLEIKEWIKPNTYMVQEISNILGLYYDDRPISERVWAAWRHVVKNVDYPLLFGIIPIDAHFVTDYAYKSRSNAFDFWYYPEETISDGTGDCEDAGFLIASLLRAFLSEFNALAVIGKVLDANGKLLGYHAWAEAQFTVTQDGKTNWYVLEGTLDKMPEDWIKREDAYASGQEFWYSPMIYFNDVTLEIFEDFDTSKRHKKFIHPDVAKKLGILNKIKNLLRKEK